MSLFIGEVPSIPREFAEDVRIRMTSGQKSWFTRLNKVDIATREILRTLISDFNRIVMLNYTAGLERIIALYSPIIPVDTGFMKANFINAFELHLTSSEPDIVEVTMSFNFFQWLNIVPYARWHVEETAGRSLTASGKKLLDMDFFTSIMTDTNRKVYEDIVKAGYDVDAAELFAQLNQLQYHMKRYLQRWGAPI